MSAASITMAHAESVAEKLAHKSEKKLEKLKNKTREEVKATIISMIPKDVYNTFLNHSSYVRTTSSMNLNILGYGRQFSFGTQLPQASWSWSTEIRTACAVHVTKLAKAENKHKALVREFYNAIRALKSYKNITLQFPEAVPYLPKVEKKTKWQLILKN